MTVKHSRPYVPTLESTRLHLDLPDIESLLSRVTDIRLPLKLAKNRISLDGTSFEIQIGNGSNGILLQWHNQLPDEWLELSVIVDWLNGLTRTHTEKASEIG